MKLKKFTKHIKKLKLMGGKMGNVLHYVLHPTPRRLLMHPMVHAHAHQP